MVANILHAQSTTIHSTKVSEASIDAVLIAKMSDRCFGTAVRRAMTLTEKETLFHSPSTRESKSAFPFAIRDLLKDCREHWTQRWTSI